MKKSILIILVLLFASNSYADFLGIVDSVKGARDEVWNKLKLAEAVKQTQIAYQNYKQSKEYYDFVQKASQHKGGIAGWYANEVKNELNMEKQQEYWRIRNAIEEEPEDTAYVKKWVGGGLDKHVKGKLDYSEEIHNLGKKRKKDLEKLADDSTKKMDDKQKDEYNRKKDLLLLRFLASIDDKLEFLMEEDVRNEKKELEFRKERYYAEQQELKSLEDAYKEASKRKPKKDPYQILKEIPK